MQRETAKFNSFPCQRKTGKEMGKRMVRIFNLNSDNIRYHLYNKWLNRIVPGFDLIGGRNAPALSKIIILYNNPEWISLHGRVMVDLYYIMHVYYISHIYSLARIIARVCCGPNEAVVCVCDFHSHPLHSSLGCVYSWHDSVQSFLPYGGLWWCSVASHHPHNILPEPSLFDARERAFFSYNFPQIIQLVYLSERRHFGPLKGWVLSDPTDTHTHRQPINYVMLFI